MLYYIYTDIIYIISNNMLYYIYTDIIYIISNNMLYYIYTNIIYIFSNNVLYYIYTNIIYIISKNMLYYIYTNIIYIISNNTLYYIYTNIILVNISRLLTKNCYKANNFFLMILWLRRTFTCLKKLFIEATVMTTFTPIYIMFYHMSSYLILSYPILLYLI